MSALRKMAQQCDEWALEAAAERSPIAAREYVQAATVFDARQDYLDAKAFANGGRETVAAIDKLERIRAKCTEVATTSTPQTATAMLALDFLDICNEEVPW